jgi:hypothetical protein
MRENAAMDLPYDLTKSDFSKAAGLTNDAVDAMNKGLAGAGLPPLEEIITTPATLSALLSDVFASALAQTSAKLTVNKQHNGHPDLVPIGVYPDDGVLAGEHGVEVKASKNDISDAHGARSAWWCQMLYDTAGAENGVWQPTRVRKVMCANLNSELHFRRNARMTDTGTRTATPNKDGKKLLRDSVVYERRGV